MRAGSGAVEAEAQRRRVSRVRPAVAVAVAVSLFCYAALVAGPQRVPTEAVSMGKDASAIGKNGVSKNAERVIQSAVRKAVSGAEKDVQQDVKSEVKSAVKEAIEEAVSSDQLLTGSKKGTKLMHTLVKDAGSAAAKAGAQEVKEYGAEMSHITNELDSQLGGLVSLHSTSKRSSSSSSKAAVGKGHKDWVSLATKVLRQQEHAGSGWRHERSNSKKQVERAVREKVQFANEEKTIKSEASYQEGKTKKGVPFGSRKNPLYVRAEHQRDSEADADFKKLELIHEAKEARKKKVKKHEHTGQDRTAVANTYLKVMEKPVVPKIVRTRSDRNEIAAKYLHQLVKEKPTLRHRSKAARLAAHAETKRAYEKAETSKANRDMQLLKKGVAVMKRGDRIEKVKLSPTIVKGVNVVKQEKKALTRPRGPDRNELAQKYLKQLKANPRVGSPFHSYVVPQKLLAHERSHLNSKAAKYLKQLNAAHTPVKPETHANRNKLAQRDLTNLHTGKAAK